MDVKLTMQHSMFDFLKRRNKDIETSTYFTFLNVYNHQNISSYRHYIKESVANEVKEEDVMTNKRTSLGKDAIIKAVNRDIGFLFTFGTTVKF